MEWRLRGVSLFWCLGGFGEVARDRGFWWLLFCMRVFGTGVGSGVVERWAGGGGGSRGERLQGGGDRPPAERGGPEAHEVDALPDLVGGGPGSGTATGREEVRGSPDFGGGHPRPTVSPPPRQARARTASVQRRTGSTTPGGAGCSSARCPGSGCGAGIAARVTHPRDGPGGCAVRQVHPFVVGRERAAGLRSCERRCTDYQG